MSCQIPSWKWRDGEPLLGHFLEEFQDTIHYFQRKSPLRFTTRLFPSISCLHLWRQLHVNLSFHFQNVNFSQNPTSLLIVPKIPVRISESVNPESNPQRFPSQNRLTLHSLQLWPLASSIYWRRCLVELRQGGTSWLAGNGWKIMRISSV